MAIATPRVSTTLTERINNTKPTIVQVSSPSPDGKWAQLNDVVRAVDLILTCYKDQSSHDGNRRVDLFPEHGYVVAQLTPEDIERLKTEGFHTELYNPREGY